MSWDKGAWKWKAYIFKDGKLTNLSSFDDDEEVACKYNGAAATLGRCMNLPKAEGEAGAVKRSQGRDLGTIRNKGQSAFRSACQDK